MPASCCHPSQQPPRTRRVCLLQPCGSWRTVQGTRPTLRRPLDDLRVQESSDELDAETGIGSGVLGAELELGVSEVEPVGVDQDARRVDDKQPSCAMSVSIRSTREVMTAWVKSKLTRHSRVRSSMRGYRPAPVPYVISRPSTDRSPSRVTTIRSRSGITSATPFAIAEPLGVGDRGLRDRRAVAPAHQDDVAGVLEPDQAGDVVDVRGQARARRTQMRSIAKAGQRRCIHLVSRRSWWRRGRTAVRTVAA